MKFTVITYDFNDQIKKWLLKEVEIECKGSGTEADPIIIDSTSKLPRFCEFYDTHLYIEIRDVKIPYNVDEISIIGIYSIENIRIENCRFAEVYIHNSSHITIKNVECDEYFCLDECNKCVLENCKFNDLYILKSKENIIRNCEISKNIRYNELKQCSNNTFINIQNPGGVLKNIDEFNLAMPLEKKTISLSKIRYFGRNKTELDYKGLGTEKDPIILEPSRNLKSEFSLYGERRFIILRNFKKKFIGLRTYKNVSFENNKIKKLTFVVSSNLHCKNNFIKKLTLIKCKDIVIDSCIISRIETLGSKNENIKLINCNIKAIEKNVLNDVFKLT